MKAQPDILTLENYSHWKHRWERRWLPYRRLTVRTSLNEDEIKGRISERLSPPKWDVASARPANWPDSKYDEWPKIKYEPRFRGMIDGDRFALTPEYITPTHLGHGVRLAAVVKGHINHNHGDVSRQISLFVRPNHCFLVPFLVVLTMMIAAGASGLLILIVETLVNWSAPPVGALVLAPSLPFALWYWTVIVRMYFRDAAVVPAIFATIGDVTFGE